MFRTLLAFFLIAVFTGTGRAQVGDSGFPALETGLSGVPAGGHIEASLVANVSGFAPGKPFKAGVRLKIAPGWHTYWINSGDSGLPISVEWKLPPGWQAGALQWPIPARHEEPGDMLTFGYDNEVMLIAEITPPANAAPGQEAEIKAEVSWLVCERTCIPGSADLQLKLPSTDAAPGAANTDLFTRYEALLPKPGEPPYPLRWEPHDTEVYLKLSGLPEKATVDFYPVTDIPRHVEPLSPGAIRIPFPKPPDAPFVRGLLVVTHPDAGAREGWYVEYRSERGTGAVQGAGAGTGAGASTGTPAAADHGLGIARALLLGLLGGFILNLMPCVLPVIALKIFGFIGQAGESREKVLKVGLAFFAGIVAWFMLVAAAVTGARAAGHEMAWAFQFQNPAFVFGMAVLVFVFALNLLGLFEIWIPGTGRMVTLSSREGYGGAFLHGMFATLLATPCTGPFLGPVLPLAFTQSAGVTFAMFAAIAVGMGLPYVVLTAQPGWMRFLPKPGPWMVRLKQVMGFLLLGTVVWLVGVLASLGDKTSAISALWILLGIGTACWIFGTWFTPGARRLQQLLSIIAMGLAVLIGLALARPRDPGGWEPWSPQRVEELRREGRAVFVDFTADWCLNCKYNERFILDTEPVRAAMRHFVMLKADWTKGDPTITAELKKLGRSGVPVYAVYPEGEGEPEVLPEILTQNIVIDALTRARE